MVNRKKTGYLAMRIEDGLTVSVLGQEIVLKYSEKGDGTIGMCPVFKYKKDARDIYGKKVELIKIKIKP